jgi:hypothetical protein
MTCRDCQHWQRPKGKRHNVSPFDRFQCDAVVAHMSPVYILGCNECDPYGMNDLAVKTAPDFGCNQFTDRPKGD